MVSRDAARHYQWIADAVKASDDVIKDAADQVIESLLNLSTGDDAVDHALRSQFLKSIEPIVQRTFSRRGGEVETSALYRVVKERSAAAFLSQYKTSLDDLDEIMKPYGWWQNAKEYWANAPLSVVERDDLATAYQMLYGPHVDQQRLLNSKLFDPQRKWVDRNGYRLSDRIWKQGDAYRARIDEIVQRGIRQGWSAEKLAGELRQYIDPAYARLRYTKSGRIYRTSSYSPNAASAARRLARTEITRVSGQATIDRARVVPGVQGIRWRLSASHPGDDSCNPHAEEDLYGLGAGVYPLDNVPPYPSHPNCMCTLVPSHEPREVTRRKIVEKYRNEAFAEAGFDPEKGWLW